jgi:tRNA pseudouridine32 synthase/23S rRNA pseudouridine746 synthase
VPESVEAGVRLAEFLVRRFPDITAEAWTDRLDRGLVVDAQGHPLTAETPCEPRLRIGYYREVADEPTGPEVEITEVDEHLVVIDKPHFLPVTPSGPFVERCVLFQAERMLGLSDLAPVHRLDRHTAGLVLLARVPAERGLYGGLFARREIVRRYAAVARLDRELAGNQWCVTSRIEPGEPFFRMQEVASGEPNAETEIELVTDHRESGETTGWGTFRLRPLSGKKHQLRLHMAAIGCPIAGDRLYPTLRPKLPDGQAPPLALVARELRFRDPVTGRERKFRSRRQPALPVTQNVRRDRTSSRRGL